MFDRRVFLKTLAWLAAAPSLAAHAGEREMTDAAAQLYRKAIVIDGNLQLANDPAEPLSSEAQAGIRASGLTVFKMTIGGSGGNYADTLKELDDCRGMIARYPELFMPIRRATDIALAKRSGRIGIIFSFEAVEMLQSNLDRIDEFSQLGVRVMQLSYNLASPFASGVLAPRASRGLTTLGHAAIAEMNAQGVSIDLSHADVMSTLQAVHASSRPVLITHGGCAAVHPHPRNKIDAELRAVAGSGGVVGIYGLPYLTAGPAQQTLADYMAHMLHALAVCGEDHVGIGSDAVLTGFDTSPQNMAFYDQVVAARKAAGIGAPGEERPPYVMGLNRADRCEIIADALLRHGYPARIAEKVLGTNFARVFADTWVAQTKDQA
ncbi:dipeptidase [Rhodanobacter sp. Col0626]|uniref:dipeptidase n=1 Tax=Rhodanobacter sp. Col0626 TaxID=3415679 RepID=UPI003CE8602B